MVSGQVAASLLALYCLVGSTGGGTSAFAQVRLAYSNFFPSGYGHSELAEAWCREIEKRTNGRVVISYYPGGTLIPAAQTFDAVKNGVADIGLSCFAYTPGRFPMMEAVDLPLGYTSGLQATAAINAYYRQFAPPELEGVKVLYLHGHGPGVLHTKRPVHRLEDLRGAKIRAAGIAAEIVRALGAEPVGLLLSESYDALNRGVVAGIAAPSEALRSWKWAEVVAATTEDFGASYTTGMYVIMNREKWSSLPPDVQRVFEQVSEEWIEKTGRLWDEIDSAGKAYSKARGNAVVELAAAENDRFAAAVRPVIEAYVRSSAAKGLRGRDGVDFLRGYLAEGRHGRQVGAAAQGATQPAPPPGPGGAVESDVDRNIPRGVKAGRYDVAVVIGNRNYQAAGVPKVEYADRDARLVRKYLVSAFGLSEDNIIYVEDATTSKFNELFGRGKNFRGKLFNYVKKDVSSVFVYYVGHGVPDVESKDAYFLPVDADPAYAAVTGYRLETFYANLAKIPAKRVVVVLDACFSGNTPGGFLMKNLSPGLVKVRKDYAAPAGSLLFASAATDQVSTWYPEKGHSLFTYYLLRGIQGDADLDRDGKVTAGELKEYLLDNVPYMARKLHNRDQEPLVIGSNDEVVIQFAR